MSETSDIQGEVIIPEAAPKTVAIQTGKTEEKKEKKPRKPRTTKKKKEVKVLSLEQLASPETIANQIKGGHMILAVFVGPEAMISDANAMMEAQAIYQIIELYGMEWLARWFPWLNLTMTVALAEYPTAYAIAMKLRANREKKKVETPRETFGQKGADQQ